MTLHDFIEKFIARNTMIRLWKNNDNTSRLMLTDETVMEWEALRIKELSDIEVIYITDILCERDREAVNIVVDTDLGREEVIKLFRDYEKRRESERKYQCEGCVQKTLKEDQGRMSITDETEKLPAVWKLENPEGLYCPKCGLFMPDYENPLEKCPKCGQTLEGWIDGSGMTVKECIKRWLA